MALIYETEQIYTGPPINIHNLDPVKQWRKHYWNWKYLSFIHNNTKDWKEKRDAHKELAIAQRKMDRWYNMSKLVLKELEMAKTEVDKEWSGK